MRKFVTIVGVLALAMLVMPAISHAQCPAIGSDTTCGIVITLNTGGTATITATGQGPYDGIEDTLVGVVNNSGGTVGSISLSGSNIFGFDFDGICTYTPFTGSGYCSSLPAGSSGYEGPGTSFTITDANDGSVSFAGGLANGGTAYFSLEESLSATSFTVTGTTGAPEPSSLLLIGSGVLSLLGLARRRLA